VSTVDFFREDKEGWNAGITDGKNKININMEK
jgi:hypothetical protein